MNERHKRKLFPSGGKHQLLCIHGVLCVLHTGTRSRLPPPAACGQRDATGNADIFTSTRDQCSTQVIISELYLRMFIPWLVEVLLRKAEECLSTNEPNQ